MTSEELRHSCRWLAHGWINLAESLEAAAGTPSEVLDQIKNSRPRGISTAGVRGTTDGISRE